MVKNKVIYVSGEDFASVFFEDWVRNNKLSFEEACTLDTIEDDEGYAEINTLTFGEIDPQFIEFIRGDIQDYEHSKDVNFYLKDDEIFRLK